jgi:hypothetical protein
VLLYKKQQVYIYMYFNKEVCIFQQRDPKDRSQSAIVYVIPASSLHNLVLPLDSTVLYILGGCTLLRIMISVPTPSTQQNDCIHDSHAKNFTRIGAPTERLGAPGIG